MGLFRILLIVMFMGITGYTAVVMTTYGSDFFPIFFGDITQFTWPGQFNLDFMCMLVVTAQANGDMREVMLGKRLVAG